MEFQIEFLEFILWYFCTKKRKLRMSNNIEGVASVKDVSSRWARMSDDAVAGGCAGFIARMVTAPFDVVKIRQQLAKAGTSASSSSLLTSFKTIIKEEGLLALWKGNLSATLLWVTYALVQFGLYGTAKSYIDQSYKQENGKQHISHWKRAFFMFLAGAGAGRRDSISLCSL
jgi:hypothetical protein